MKPMLAVAVEDISKINYPIIASSKKDGLRVLVMNGVLMSRSMKPIPSKAVQEKFGNRPELEGYDAELIYGDSYAKDVFNKTTSFCMSHSPPEGMSIDNVQMFVFDKFDEEGGWIERFASVVEYKDVIKLRHHMISDEEQLRHFQTMELEKGAEGVMLRSLNGKYKQGRSTLKEGLLLKLKEFTDAEAIVIGFEEKMHNTNVATINELGYTERSSAKDGLVGAGTLGALIVHDVESSVEFSIGTGFDDKLRKEIWENKDEWMGKIVKYKSFKIGEKDKPRFPVMLGIRHKDDM